MASFWSMWIIVLTSVTIVGITWILFANRKREQQPTDKTTGHEYDGIQEFDGAGSRNQSNAFATMPELRANFGTTWYSGNHTARIGVNHIGDYTNDQSNDAVINS